MPGHRLTSQTIDDEQALRAVLGPPSALVCAKLGTRLNPLSRQFVERSPFVCIATADDEGRCDVSPRGDPAGFVRILDDSTLLLPERPGNRLADSLRNILRTGRVGLMFVVPGVGDTFRINGRATITNDAALLAGSAIGGNAPKLGILVDIEEAFMHCSKAFLRSDLWNPSAFVERAELPSSGAMLRELSDEEFDAETYDAERAARYARREGFY